MEKHGETKTKLHNIWVAMRQRCNNSNQLFYANYGGRGIEVCEDWQNSYISFRDWSLSNGYAEGLSIDRQNTEGNYNPSNCRWTTKKVQSRNATKPKSNTSGYVGVVLHKPTNKWNARLVIDYKRKSLGYHNTAKEAAMVRDKYIIDNNLEHTLNFTRMGL